jgi:hypothetical protein
MSDFFIYCVNGINSPFSFLIALDSFALFATTTHMRVQIRFSRCVRKTNASKKSFNSDATRLSSLMTRRIVSNLRFNINRPLNIDLTLATITLSLSLWLCRITTTTTTIAFRCIILLCFVFTFFFTFFFFFFFFFLDFYFLLLWSLLLWLYSLPCYKSFSDLFLETPTDVGIARAYSRFGARPPNGN